MSIEIRPVLPADEPFLFRLYASTREFELAQVPWPTEQKQAFLRMQYTAQQSFYTSTRPRATHEIICADGEPAGRLWLDRESACFHILDITIVPERRNAGIGGEVLRRILDEATGERKPVSIYTETFNASLRLFERLGFRQVSVDGFLVLLERPTPAQDQSAG